MVTRVAPGGGQPRILAGYEILFELGQGGMGAAFLARAAGSEGFERLVVIKRPLPKHPSDAEAISRFLREARIAAAIHHANVAGTQQVGEDERGPFIVLDYVDGASFADLSAECSMSGASVPPRVALRIVLDALAGLEAVHSATNARGVPLNILHRDVSLGNILVGRDGMARLSDFGVAKSEQGAARTKSQRYLVGKLPYVSPEYLHGRATGPEADVYAAGVTLWLALAGGDPWPEADDAELMRHILDDGIPPLPARTGVSPELAELVARACAHDPSKRFRSARELSEAIEQLERTSSPIATHREVARWVEEVLGRELAERRERIARFAAPEGALEPLPARARRETAATLAPYQLVWQNQRRRVLTGAAALGLIGGAVFFVWRSGARPAMPRPSDDLARAPEKPRIESVAAAASAPGSAVPEPGPVPSVVPAPSARAELVQTTRAPQAPKPSPTRAPNQIRRGNPYR